MPIKKKSEDPLWRNCPPEVKKLRAQATREIRVAARKAWKEKNGK